MALTDNKINGSTPIREFPDKYNTLIDQLVTKINELEDSIAEKDATIQVLRSQVSRLQSDLRSEFGAWFDQKMDEFENKFVKKEDN